MKTLLVVPVILAFPLFAQPRPVRDASQPVDEEYTKKIREYTTEPFFNSPLTDYLPASKTVPTPKAVLGDVAGAPGILPYSHEVYRYMRMLEAASPRVKVFSIGKTEEGREMIAVAVADERLLAKLDENRARLAKLADPRTLHLHESVPYLYDNTVGDGPYNAWIDPILAGEWQMMGWNNVSEMTAFGMPGVFTHGTFDTWSPSYLMFIAAMHNGISRLYETFGNGGADTEERTLQPGEFARTWYKQNPPLPKAKWSQRNNNNYEETGLLTGLAYFS